MLRNLGIFFLGIVFLVTISLTFSFIGTVMAQESEILSKITNDNKQGKHHDDDDDNDKLVVVAQINLKDTERNGLLKVVGVINGEDFVKTIPLDTLKETTKKLKVKFSMDKENEIVSAGKPDEFFVCAYHIKNTDTKINYYDKQGIIEYFDCNEGDILNIKKPTEINLFKADSQVYAKSKAVYQANLNNVNGSNSDTVKIKIYAPLADKKDTKKLVIAAMIKGQIQSEVIEDVQSELDKSDGSTISRTFTFDRDTNIGKIQIGDRFHACVSSNDLNPPEGTECEKRTVKKIGRDNVLYAR